MAVGVWPSRTWKQNMSALPEEKISELRQAIHGHVSQGKIQEQIRACLSEALAQEGGREMSEAELLQVLEKRGIVEQVMKNLDFSTTKPEEREEKVRGQRDKDKGHVTEGDHNVNGHAASIKPQPGYRDAPAVPGNKVSPPKRCLFLQVLGGRAFLDHLPDPTPCPHTHFTLHIHFRGQRYHSRDVPCACEPDFREGFLLELEKCSTILSAQADNKEVEGRMISLEDCLGISDPIQLALTRTNHRGEVNLVGTYSLEWRKVLSNVHGQYSISLELVGVGAEAKITPGILDLRIDLVPHPCSPLHSDLLAGQLSLERQRTTEKERLLLVYAKQWWKEYLQIRPKHSERLVKIFAPDEGGLSRLVCAYIQPLRSGRLLDSPRHAARFVSLIPFEKAGSVGSSGSCSEMWSSPFSMLVSKRGDCEAHACLLCSLLLGFGLDAYVCIGTKAKGLAHAWVMTRPQGGEVVFWESITGQRYVHPPFDPNTQAGMPLPLPAHPYRTVGCVFNHKTFYANSQPSNDISTCSFALEHSSLWKTMSPEAIKSVTRKTSPSPLLPPVVDANLAANEMEMQLRTLTSQHREDLGLGTVWDNDLCYLLTPALSAYELERCLGVGGIGNEEFQEAVHSAVPDGHTFKGFPIQLLHRNPRKAFNTCLQSPVCAEILSCRGDHVRLAVRVKMYFYPENICAVWIMFAVKYQSVL